MKTTIHFLLSWLLLGSFNLMAQNWTVGGNNLPANGLFGTNNNRAVIFETNNTERGRIASNGLWGFGATAPSAKVHINSGTGTDPLKVSVGNTVKFFVHRSGGVSIGNGTTASTNGLFVTGSTGIGSLPGSYKVKMTHGTFGINIENSSTLDDWELWSNSSGLSLYSNGNFRGTFDITTGAYSSVSDERLKTDIQDMPSVLKKVNQLKPTTYQFKSEGSDTKRTTPAYGFLAQEVMEVFPHLVTHTVNKERDLDTYTMDYSGFGVIAIKAIQEMQQNISTLENRIVQLEAALEAANKNGMPVNKGSVGVWLEKNFPNPFSQSTYIGYTAPAQAQQIDLIITNMQGVEIQRFQQLQAGQGQIEITAGSIPDGTYIYTLLVDGKPAAAQKMVLTR